MNESVSQLNILFIFLQYIYKMKFLNRKQP